MESKPDSSAVARVSTNTSFVRGFVGGRGEGLPREFRCGFAPGEVWGWVSGSFEGGSASIGVADWIRLEVVCSYNK